MFKQLITFKTLYETKSFSKTAELLFIAQPTVSAQIKQLETELEAQLFIRNGRQELQITPQAELLYQKAVVMLEEWTQLENELRLKRHQIQLCRIGASHTFATNLLPQLLIALYREFPQIKFSIKLLNSFEVLQELEHHTLDLGFIEKPLAAKDLQRWPLMKDQMVLAGNPKGPWLLRESSSGVYYYTKRYLEEKGITGEQLTIANNEIIVELLRNGFGCSVLSRRAAAGIPYEDLGPDFERCFYLLKRESDGGDGWERYTEFIRRWGEAYEGEGNKNR